MDARAPEPFAALLRRYRLAAELSQEELAERAHLSRLAVSALERGVRRAPYRDTVRMLADALGLSDDDRAQLEASVGRARRSPVALPALPDPAHGNLPALTTSFVGRVAEQATILRLLAATRLLTLTGTGGAGKSRLAVEVAGGLAHDLPDGIRLVELAPLADLALVPQAVARVIGVQERPGEALIETMIGALAEQELLLVLDNCEHVRTAAGELVERLRRGCPRLRILATSREALGVPGETVWRVPPMSLPPARFEVAAQAERNLTPADWTAAVHQSDAAQLFMVRACAAHPVFELTDANADAVAAICRRLDGIPLAIELAAARARVLTPEQIAARLDARLQLLTRGSPDALARHQTLRATLDWSYDLLTEAEQRLLARLSVFAGGCDLDAAEAVCSDDDIAPDGLIDLLTDLADKSLIVVEYRGEAARYRLLETVREYAAERLAASTTAEAVPSRLAGWALAMAEYASSELKRSDQAAWHDRLDAEHDNLRAVLQWALDNDQTTLGLQLAGTLRLFWERRGYLSEGRGWHERLLAQDRGSPGSVRAQAWQGAGFLARFQGDFPVATVYAEQALELCRETGDQAVLCDTLHLVGEIATERSDWPAAEAHFRERLTIARALDDHNRIASSLTSLGVVARWLQRLNEAQAYYDEAIAIDRKLGNLTNVAICLNNVARVAQMSGDLVRAREGFEEAVAIARSLGNRHQSGIFLGSLADVVRLLGDLPAARRYGEEALALAREIGDRPGMAYAYSILAAIERESGDFATAWSYTVANLELARDLSDVRRTQPALWQAAALAQATGRPDAAARLFGAAIAIMETAEVVPDTMARRLEEHLAMLRAVLGEDAVAAAYADGRGLTPEAAIAFALAGAPLAPITFTVYEDTVILKSLPR
jgi:predicted ATPase/DNA-binding XRE family transcriptional regulator